MIQVRDAAIETRGQELQSIMPEDARNEWQAARATTDQLAGEVDDLLRTAHDLNNTTALGGLAALAVARDRENIAWRALMVDAVTDSNIPDVAVRAVVSSLTLDARFRPTPRSYINTVTQPDTSRGSSLTSMCAHNEQIRDPFHRAAELTLVAEGLLGVLETEPSAPVLYGVRRPDDYWWVSRGSLSQAVGSHFEVKRPELAGSGDYVVRGDHFPYVLEDVDMGRSGIRGLVVPGIKRVAVTDEEWGFPVEAMSTRLYVGEEAVNYGISMLEKDWKRNLYTWRDRSY